MKRKINPGPCTRLGWQQYYVRQFNKTGDQSAAVMACWYLTLQLAFGDQANG